MFEPSEERNIEVLLVEDEESVLESLKTFLEMEPGLSVIGLARDGLEALEQAQKLSPQVIVMDVRMPRMDGLQATRSIKAQYPEMRIILLSMYDNEELIQAGKEAGANRYLLKGTASQELVKAIKEDLLLQEGNQ